MPEQPILQVGNLIPSLWPKVWRCTSSVAADKISFELGPGMATYCLPGIAGAHEWETKDHVQLLAVCATVESDRKPQFTVDRQPMRSYVDLENLARSEAISFKSHY